ncbi:hypothetical protein D3C80_1160720 [compost metagenome]
MAADATQDQVKLVDGRVGAATGVNQLAITLHGAQTTAQGLHLIFSGQAEFIYQLLAVRGRATVGQMLQNQLTAGNGVFVFFRFTSGLGIEGLPIGH